jgi:hypothetical protein
VPQSLVVTLNQGSPAGIVFNGSTAFTITENANTGGAPFIFATLQGQIEAWSPAVSLNEAFSLVDNGLAGARYTGLAIGVDASNANLLFAANFTQHRVDVFDTNYAITTIGGSIYVTYAMLDDSSGDEVKGAGLGIVDVFDTQGMLVKRLVNPGGALNSPWGIAMAPSNFGPLSGKLLVGNFGDGKINAFDPTTGALAGFVKTNAGAAIVIDGLWGIAFGNGLNSQPTNTLFYAAGPDDEQEGRYGRIDMD